VRVDTRHNRRLRDTAADGAIYQSGSDQWLEANDGKGHASDIGVRHTCTVYLSEVGGGRDTAIGNQIT